MKRRLAGLALVTLCTVSLPAAAQWYVAGDLGSVRYTLTCNSGASCDNADAGVRIGGGYQLNRYLAFELSTFDFGSATIRYRDPPPDGSIDTISVSGIGWSVLAILPIERFSMYGRMGFGRVESSRVNSMASGGNTHGDSETRLLFGLGVAHEFTKNLAARLEVFGAVQFIYSEQDVTQTSLGLVYRF